ncbi:MULTISPECIES: phosphoadenosine phosphosulfate reductase family protein [unclassified Acinetobacter]|uniref:phosphoadenosine phosphosulfate reductase domain-containing protein n=1 Tax=unclassified Acinetobacter TaxID=196816 RepID=UPI0015D0E9CC|nr:MULTISPECIES: phosphoadenosine phosphosulfate reductase family protein [unclassified Acinetobacter]
MATQNIVSVSGGKDSTATLLLAIALEVENLTPVFADTGHEHQETYDYLFYLEQKLNLNIKRVKADFSREIARKREYVMVTWRKQGVPESIIENALSVLVPTGVPFLDLCLWKGLFPSRKKQFCTKELKIVPQQQLYYPLLDQGDMVISWQGVRREESLARRYLNECDQVCDGLFNYRPILKWSVKSVFDAHFDMGVKPNPLYMQGMNRVGCMPCINTTKDELAEISRRYPEEIERVREWESLVSLASKKQSATLLTSDYRGHGIIELAEWSKTSFGGQQYDLIGAIADTSSCVSAYGLCE